MKIMKVKFFICKNSVSILGSLVYKKIIRFTVSFYKKFTQQVSEIIYTNCYANYMEEWRKL